MDNIIIPRYNEQLEIRNYDDKEIYDNVEQVAGDELFTFSPFYLFTVNDFL